MLIRRKSSTDDEYHHEDPLGVFGVITGASGAVLSSNVYDSFMGMQYVQGVSKTTQPATCYKAMSEPGLLTGSGGRGVVVPSRGFQVMGSKPAPVKKHPCKTNDHPLQGGYQIAIECCDYATQWSHDSFQHCVNSGCLVLHPLPQDAPGYRACLANARRAFKNGCPHSPPSKIDWPMPGEVDPHHDGDPPKPGEDF